ncbi:endonuclease/exonuclease/phosphatase family protein [Croceivirga sp. JEA036]|uniref:endonuclease/exonuclease/phosphatase family protein n=1 Tax=Croceivirga sp. JEA036 TaxID=2721162 RepID=UPI0014396417|nr:endonuclease/exonuclease/phosphatase family protein [Croceivirga sp. JEA036]NJB38149.1 endonuclease [Croceivirga sp. JEA036]
MENQHVIAFYNLENLFDTVDDPHILDDDFTKKGFKKWKNKRYLAKTRKLAKAISKIGEDDGLAPPVLVGVAEIENKRVVERLLGEDALKNLDYGYVHYDSPDERGIDTALFYRKDNFEVLSSETIPLLINSLNGERDFTRDILYVHGKLNGEALHIFVNHWPSRRDGAKLTAYKRIAAAHTIIEKLEQIRQVEGEPNVLVMGDFNDDPNSDSIKTLMKTGWFINPMEKSLSPDLGSANYKGKWSLFDQIIVSHSFLNHEPNTHSFSKAKIFAPHFLKEWKGKYKGTPFRTFGGKRYLGGYSDHFPVYLVLKKN